MVYTSYDAERGRRESGKPCRMDQLFLASTMVINAARDICRPGVAFESDESRQALRDELVAALMVFDRLNGGI